MNFTRFLALVAVTSASASANNTIIDQFRTSTNCTYSLSAPYTNCDVIGNQNFYDIQKATADVTPSHTTVDLYFNYGGGASLADFHDGITLGIGDLFFFNPSNFAIANLDPATFNPALPNPYSYAVAMTSHDGFTQGGVYQIGGTVTTKTADNLINNSRYYYRRGETVRIGGSGAMQSHGTVQVVSYGNGVTNPLYHATIDFSNPAGFYSTIVNSDGQIGISFASAYCGNDIVRGVVDANPVPEPGSVVLMFTSSLALLGLALRRKYRRVA